MVKHAQTIRKQQPTNCLSVFDHFVGLVLIGLIEYEIVKVQLKNHFGQNLVFLTVWESIPCVFTKAVVRKCSENKVFLEISQNSQENTSTRVSFFGICEIFENTFSYRTPLVAASVPLDVKETKPTNTSNQDNDFRTNGKNWTKF